MYFRDDPLGDIPPATATAWVDAAISSLCDALRGSQPFLDVEALGSGMWNGFELTVLDIVAHPSWLFEMSRKAPDSHTYPVHTSVADMASAVLAHPQLDEEHLLTLVEVVEPTTLGSTSFALDLLAHPAVTTLVVTVWIRKLASCQSLWPTSHLGRLLASDPRTAAAVALVRVGAPNRRGSFPDADLAVLVDRLATADAVAEFSALAGDQWSQTFGSSLALDRLSHLVSSAVAL